MTIWFTARGAGLAALVLLTVSTALGAGMSGQGASMSGRGRASGRVITQHVHRTAASLGLGVLVLHIATILADSYAHVGVTGAIVPFTSSYRATWVGLGTIAGYTIILVAALGFARGRVAATPRGAAVWRGLHGLGYVAWALAIGHGFLAGTDSSVTWVRALYLICIAAVAGAVTLRVLDRRPAGLVRHPAPVPAPAPVPSAVAR